MKTTALLIGLFVFSGPVMAETYQVRTDPSGAPMCFTESGDKAPLDRCPSATIALDLLASR